MFNYSYREEYVTVQSSVGACTENENNVRASSYNRHLESKKFRDSPERFMATLNLLFLLHGRYRKGRKKTSENENL